MSTTYYAIKFSATEIFPNKNLVPIMKQSDIYEFVKVRHTSKQKDIPQKKVEQKLSANLIIKYQNCPTSKVHRYKRVPTSIRHFESISSKIGAAGIGCIITNTTNALLVDVVKDDQERYIELGQLRLVDDCIPKETSGRWPIINLLTKFQQHVEWANRQE